VNDELQISLTEVIVDCFKVLSRVRRRVLDWLIKFIDTLYKYIRLGNTGNLNFISTACITVQRYTRTMVPSLH
jgi:hypothetical protein